MKGKTNLTKSLLNIKEEWERTFDSIPDLIAILNGKHQIIRINKAMAQRLGLKSKECIGLNCFKCVHKLNKPPSFCPHSLTMKDGKTHTVEIHEENLGGDFLVSTTPLFSNKRKIIGSIHILRDITQRKKIENTLKESEKKYRDLFNSMSVAFALSEIIFDVSGKPYDYNYIEANESWIKITGLSKEKIIGKTAREVFPGEEPEWLEKYSIVALTGKSVHFEQYNHNLDKWFEVSAYSPKKNYFARTLMDITERKKIEQRIIDLNKSLTKEKDIIKSLMENTQAQLAYLDKDFNFIDINSAYAKGSGHTRQELVGKNHFAFFPDKENELIFKKVRETREPFEIKAKPFVYQDQPERGITYWDWTLTPLKGEKNAVVGFVLSLVDVTENVLREENLKKYVKFIEKEKAKDDALLSNIADGIVAVDQKGKIMFANDAFALLIDRNLATLKNERLDKVAPLFREDGNRIIIEERPGFIALKTGKNFSSEFGANNQEFWLHVNNKKIPVAINATPIFIDGKVIGAVSLLRDVTKELEIDRAKTEFLSMAAHQLRTPLATMSLTAEMLLKGLAGKLDSGVKRYLNDFFKDVQTMSQLVKIFLNVSRIDLGTLPINQVPTNVQKIAESTMKDLLPQIRKKKLRTKRDYIKNIPVINTDPKILGMAIENIVTNSIKYTPENGLITLKIKKKMSDLIIEISDTGFGIPKKEQPRIFTKLYRAQNIIQSEGAGLGLYIAKYSVEKIGGRIWFKSKEGKGTTFYISLPVKKA